MATNQRIYTAKILLVDEDPANVRVLEEMLGAARFIAVSSVTDARAVEAMHLRERYDLILLDLKMPQVDGIDLLARLRQVAAPEDCPILVVTAQSDLPARLHGLEAGAQDFIGKPFERTEVVSRIRNLLEMRLLHRELREQNRHLEEQVRERTRELAETRMEIIRRLGRAAEYRDNESGMHVIRMSRYAQVLGRAAGMSEDEAETLLNASPMHDVGKIGVPDRVLLKPAPLNTAEWELMKSHTRIGAEILSGHPSELLEMAATVALTHHERWDGSGYPRGLAGTGIPLAGRVVAVCDVFDALTSARPYKTPWRDGDAINYMSLNSGRHFDPGLIERFNEALPDILSIKERYREPETVRAPGV